MKKDAVGKLPPHDNAIEESVLGSIIIYEDSRDFIMSQINEHVFYNHNHKIIFSCIQSLYNKKSAIDLLTVVSGLKSVKQLENVGGPYAISLLTNKAGSFGNVETHCRILQEFCFRREIIRISHKTENDAYDALVDVFELMDRTTASIKKISNSLTPDEIHNNNDLINQVIEDSKKAKDQGGVIGITTGLKSLDFGIRGLISGNKYVIAARPSMGKSSLWKSIMIHLSHKLGKRGVFFSMEMTAKQVMLVMISEILQIDNDLIQSGNLTETQLWRIEQLKGSMFTDKLIIYDKPGLTPSQMRRVIKKLNEKGKIQYAASDYTDLIVHEDPKGKTKEQIISDNSKSLKNIAKEEDIPWIEIAQLNREVEKRSGNRPILSDLKDSGGIEASADVVILLYRPEYYDIKEMDGISTDGYAEAIIAKNRFGGLKTLPLKYIKQFTSFVDSPLGTEVKIETSTDFFM